MVKKKYVSSSKDTDYSTDSPGVSLSNLKEGKNVVKIGDSVTIFEIFNGKIVRVSMEEKVLRVCYTHLKLKKLFTIFKRTMLSQYLMTVKALILHTTTLMILIKMKQKTI